VVVNADGTVTYTPDPGFSGVDTFTYTVSDGTTTATGTVTVTVTAAQSLPVTGCAGTDLVRFGLMLVLGGSVLVLAFGRRRTSI
jgi:hypothetical protein